VRTGLCLRDLVGFEAMAQRLDTALLRRNYYVLDALAGRNAELSAVALRVESNLKATDDLPNGNGWHSSASSEDASEEAVS
jgi:hypothetical protein